MSNIYSILTKILPPLVDRPLISLLPFYIWGIYSGWEAGGGAYVRPLIAAAVGAGAAAALSFSRSPFNKYLILLLIPAVFLLGSGLISRTLSPPEDPRHLLRFTSEERFAPHFIVGGVVLETSKRPDSRYQRLIIDGREIFKAGDAGPDEILAARGLARIEVNGEAIVRPGDYVRLPAVLRRLSGLHNPGGLNPEKFWAAQGIWVSAYVKDPALINSWPHYSGPGPVPPLRERAAEFLYARAPYPAAGLLASLLLGRRTEVDEVSETTFRNLGLTHILSVSGLHFGLWYGLCLWLTLIFLRRVAPRLIRAAAPGRWKKLAEGAYAGRSLLLASVIALGPALLYAALVGGASPVIRATVMVAAAALAIVARRGSDTWNIMAVAAWALLLAEPHRLFSASFQMSFVATAALVAVFRSRSGHPELTKIHKKPGLWTTPLSPRFLKSLFSRGRHEAADDGLPPRRESFFRGVALASVAGTLGSAPLVIWHFSRLPLAGFLGNLIFGPLLSALVLIPGLLSLMTLPFSETAASLLMNFSASALMFMMPVMEAGAEAAGPGLLWPIPGKLFLIAYFAGGWILLNGRFTLKKRLALCGAVLAAGLAPYLISGQGERGVLRFTVLAVGQGSSIHINFPDRRQMVIDGGGSRYFDPGERVITPYLLRRGIHKLDYLALTHPDEDHLRGLISLSRNFRPDEIWEAPWPKDFSPLYGEFREATARIGRADPRDLWGGWRLGPVTVETLWPEPDAQWPSTTPRGEDWANSLGMVFKITWGGISFLVTGDIEKKTERRLAEIYGPKLAATVLVAPHHGSAASLSEEFLSAVKPDFVVFSVGNNNYFGHPHARWLESASRRGAVIWRTDHQGAAVFEARKNGGAVELKLLPPQ